MASQIEQTVASLTTLSKEHTAQLNGFFKDSEAKFYQFRTTRLAKVTSFFRRLESQVLPSRSPVKSLQKKRRRKPTKATRTARDTQKLDARITATQSVRNTIDHDKSLSQPSIPHSEVLELSIQPPALSSDPACLQSSKHTSKVEKPTKQTTGVRISPTERSSGSTSSFRSAVESPIRDFGGSELENSDDRYHSLGPGQNLPRSPDHGESQWKDCRSNLEPVPQRNSEGSLTGKEVRKNSRDIDAKEAPVGAAKTLARSPTGDHVRRGEDLPSLSKADRSDDEDAEKFPMEEEVNKGVSSKTGRSHETPSSIEEAKSHLRPIKQKAKLSEQCSISDEEKDHPLDGGPEVEGESHGKYMTLSEDDNGENQNQQSVNDRAQPNQSEKTKEKNSPSSEDYKNYAKSAPCALQTDNSRTNNFEFKAPKPKTTNPISSSLHVERVANFNQTSTGFEKHFKVDEQGKINNAGIGILSKIASTPSTGAKLFKATTDIYSSQRKPALSRVLSVQKSNMSSRASVLAHTPGAHAPTTRLASQSFLTGQNTNGLRDSLAALKQPITESKIAQPKVIVESNNTGAWNDRLKSLLRSNKPEEYARTDGKRLTFADGYKQMEGNQAQSERALEPQTAPTKEFRQPRIRRDTEKSALRRRIEEIRGKASSSTITNPTSSPSMSSTERMRSSSPQCHANRRESSTKTISTGTEQTLGSSENLSSPTLERNKAFRLSQPWKEVDSSERTHDNGTEENTTSERGADKDDTAMPSRVAEEALEPEKALQEDLNGSMQNEIENMVGQQGDETSGRPEDEIEAETGGAGNVLANLMCSVSSLCPGASTLLGVRSNEERSEESAGESAVKRQKLDIERREAERLARIEAQRAARQKETEEKQRRAEARRQILAAAEKTKEDDRRRKEEQRKKAKRVEEEQKRRKKWEEDRKREERRRLVLEKRAMQQEQSKRKGHDGKRQRVGKQMERGTTGIPKPGGLGGTYAKSSVVERTSMGCGERGEDGLSSYAITPAKATLIEESDEEKERRRDKAIPRWAGDRRLEASAQSQPDPDKVFVNMPMCNLKEVFGNGKQYRTRSSSANWTQDRVTTGEMTKYKKAMGGFRDV